MELGERIKYRREELDMTQEELAKAMGYNSKSSITKIEKGVTNLSDKKLKQMAAVLDVQVSYLIGPEPKVKKADILAKYKELVTGLETTDLSPDRYKSLLSYFNYLKKEQEDKKGDTANGTV